MTIKALETHYAGCRFRSRLEARWAVFCDNLGITWQYEPEGLSVGHRLSLDEGRFPYLPDFFLPDFDLWVEVKGSLDITEATRLLDAAASLSSNDGGGCHDDGGRDLLVLGPIPPEYGDRLPVRLHMHKGQLQATRWNPLVPGAGKHDWESIVVAEDYGYGGAAMFDSRLGAERGIRLLLKGMWGAPFSRRAEAAFASARKARFEHGERG